ncbi:MAG: hypothetical protein HC767_09565 [Akkermansiaceae bacterium]|nr:hypothetical protein [Akkermansiaceae bacterium]
MRLFRLTLASILQRKAWVVCAFCILAFPFILPFLSSAAEKPVLVQPARIQAAWGTLWVCALVWGLYTAAHEGDANAKSGIGEYFKTTGVSATRQLFEIWLALFCFIAPFTLLAAAVCQFAAAPGDSLEHSQWWIINSQYIFLFLLVISPLMALSTAIASRFGGIAGFAITLTIALYGLYGVGYLDSMLKVDENPILRGIWLFSPHYHFADLTQRLQFKWGYIPANYFWVMVAYFSGIFAVYCGISRLCFRIKSVL